MLESKVLKFLRLYTFLHFLFFFSVCFYNCSGGGISTKREEGEGMMIGKMGGKNPPKWR